MQAPIGSLLAGGIELANKTCFKVVIAYEDYPTGARAKTTYDYLLRAFGRDCEFDHTMWRFDALRIPELRQIAANEAAQADMIILGVWSRSLLPVEVKTWTEQWLQQKSSRLSTLTVLIENHPGGCAKTAASILDYLRDVSQRGQMDFFSQIINAPESARGSSARRTANGATRITPAFDDAWEDPERCPGWGLNE